MTFPARSRSASTVLRKKASFFQIGMVLSLLTPVLLQCQPAQVQAAPETETQDQWNGYARHAFKFEGRQCYVVDPRHDAPGKPWLWRARFWGHRPEVDFALLDRGFHLVYMDVAEMLGNPEAVEHWNHFYTLVTTRYGLSKKAALEGMSRGGLYIYSWAAANPDKVTAIYADAPVCDITTWPMNTAPGFKLLAGAFGFKTVEDVKAYKGNPIDILTPIAKARIPLLHVVGDADAVVPVDRNTAVLAERYEALGGEIEIIHKPGIGHKHGLDDPTPIIQFLLRHNVDPLTVVPQFQNGDVVTFIGDSITHSRKWHKYISDFYLTRFPERHIRFLNAGNSGDTAGGALRRLDTDILPEHPNAAVIMLGMNDVKRDLYQAKPPTEADLASRSKALQDYRTNMTQLVGKLSQSGVKRFIFVESSPFDETAALATATLPGVNEAIRATGQVLRELAAKTGGSLVDFNTPMLELNREGQRTDPAYTIIGPDRVHPLEPGMLVMAEIFLEAQDVPALVAKMTVDAQKDDGSECIRCRISETIRKPGRLEFTITETSLPFPVDPALKQVAPQFDQEILVVTHLAAGKYRLTIDGEAILEAGSPELAKGMNLALDPSAPQFRQAQEIFSVNEERRKLIVQLRDLAKVEENILRPRNVPVDHPDLVKKAIDEFLAKQTNPYYKGLVASYYRTKPAVDEIRRQIADLTTKLESMNTPKPHTYALSSVL